MNFQDFDIIDSHIHYGNPAYLTSLMKVMDSVNINHCNIVCTPHPQRLSLVPDALHLKSHFPEKIYVFGGLDISPFFFDRDNAGKFFAAYVDTLVEMGCDGIKMIEGKPDTRKMLSVPPFDSEIYEPYWEKVSSSGVPIIFHVNDPEEFWDRARVPDWAYQQGWFYGDGEYVNNEQQYTEVIHVLERFPDLKVIFAHFFFLSAQLDRLDEYLDRFPNMHVDLTPGIEMYYSFAADPEITRQFFIKHQDRIVFGTDIGATVLLENNEIGVDPLDSSTRVNVIRNFLESENEFWYDEGAASLFGAQTRPFQGIYLPAAALKKIYQTNFEKLVGTIPAPIKPSAIVQECDRIIQSLGLLGAATPGEPADTSTAHMVKQYFLSKA